MALDRRLNAFRPDLADRRLSGQVEATRFAEGRPARVITSKTAIRIQPEITSAIDTELLYGEEAMVFDRKDGWAWVQSMLDGYVGYVQENALADVDVAATHWVTAPRTFLYPEPDMKTPPVETLSMGSRLMVTGTAETRRTPYLLTAQGAIIASHATPVGQPAYADHVAIAERLLETPYLWGGRSSFGLDCSGLVQMAMTMSGHTVLRDADLQEQSIGTVIEQAQLRHGDLVFWKGHVAMMADTETIIHANGYTMSVVRERLAIAINRILPIYGRPRLFRRPG